MELGFGAWNKNLKSRAKMLISLMKNENWLAKILDRLQPLDIRLRTFFYDLEFIVYGL